MVHRQKQRRDWLYLFKYITPNKSSGEALPDTLSPCILTPFDLALKLFEVVEKPLCIIENAPSPPPLSLNKHKSIPKNQLEPTILPTQEKSPECSISEELPSQKEEKCEKTLEENPSSIPESIPTLIAKQLSPFSYASRVARWFNALQFPLDQSQFPEYVRYQESYQRRMVSYHAFTSTVDFYIKELALETVWKNPNSPRLNIRYILPSEMTLPGLKKTRGAIVYTVDTLTNELYHRFFSEKTTEELIEKVSTQTFQEIDFPELSSLSPEYSLSPPYQPIASQQEEEISIHPFLGTVTITNKQTREKLSLFRVRPLEE